MSISITKNNFLLHQSSSTDNINSRSPRVFFDDLLIPSLPPNSHQNKISKSYSYNTRSAPATLASRRSSSIISSQLPQKKSNTAPASPQHISFGENRSFITPTSSPNSNNHIQLSTKTISTNNIFSNNFHLNHFPLPNENYNKFNKNIHLLNQLNESIMNSTQKQVQNKNLQLPSLRHLKLLPNPKIQENSFIYPDTSEVTPYWKDNLIDWCKKESGNDYVKIQDQIQMENVKLNVKFSNFTKNYKNISESYLNDNESPSVGIPSVLKLKDAFQNLTSKHHHYKAPVTPPMSPKRSNNDRILSPSKPIEILKFNPFVSEKLVQLVKNEKKDSNGHKKTNSFKALQIKNLLDDRDILSKTSKKVSKKNNKFNQSYYYSSTLSSPSSIIIGAKARQLVMKFDRDSGSDSDNHSQKSSTSSQSGRSRSTSPVRRRRGSTSPSSAKFHKFLVESPPHSPDALSQQQAKRIHHHNTHHHAIRTCVSCQSSDSPCWRPSWSKRKQDQLCNSCGLRFKKTHTRCLNDSCRKIPTKGELNIMKSNGMDKDSVEGLEGLREGFRCLFCNSITETTAM